MSRWCLIALVSIASLGYAGNAAAQSEEDVARAQAYFGRGAEKFAAGEYAKAVAEFLSGHAIVPNAMFLYNVSLCYERLGNVDEALSAGVKAQQFEGMPPEVAVRNQARIASLRVVLRSHEVGADVASVVVVEEELPSEPKMVTQADGVTLLGWSGLALTGVGAGLLVGGVLTNAAIQKDIEPYEAAAASGDKAAYDELGGRIASRQSTGKLLYGIGIGAAGLGLTLFIVDLFVGTEEVPVATVTPTRDGAMVTATLRF